ncbi:transglycosylase SLT domain-containing protein [Providencia alcalifaciens]|uniref:transglycosylase SLT domain-containing protein n=1 Tax=Providencia alcalifaciens TaxID=126385 RepID=UPI0032D9E09A
MITELILLCAPNVHVETMDALIKTESAYNPNAIALIKGSQKFNPKSKAELIKMADFFFLKEDRVILDYYQGSEKVSIPLKSVSDIEKIDFSNFDNVTVNLFWGNGSYLKDNKSAEKIIDILEFRGANYSVGLGQVNKSNFERFGVTGKDMLNSCQNLKVSQSILAECYKRSPNNKTSEALSCYYSGGFNYGFKKEKDIGNSYIQRIVGNFNGKNKIVVPSIENENVFINQKTVTVNKGRGIDNNNIIQEKGTRVVKNLDTGEKTVSSKMVFK